MDNVIDEDDNDAFFAALAKARDPLALTLPQYQEGAMATAVFNRDGPMEYLIPALGAEVGELMDIFAKSSRDGTPMLYDSLKKELGDVLWMVTAIADQLDMTLEDVARTNLKKLQSRQRRGVLGGSGDNR